MGGIFLLNDQEVDGMVQRLVKRLKQIRLEHGWTEKEVAQKLNMTTKRYMSYELGTRDLDFLLICSIAEVYDILPSESLKGL